MNRLYFGDNLDIMKKIYHQEHQKEFIDLIYVDPPFNSKRNYNVLFESIDMDETKAQKEAFADTWSNVSYIDTLNEIKDLDLNLYGFLKALDNISISKSAISYLATMGIRIWYIHKLLKPTGSLYLHCDPTMSHYLKIECDLIFGEKNFRNEIIWQRINAKGNVQKKFGAVHDSVLRFSKGNDFTWNQVTRTLNDDYVNTMYRYIEKETGRRYRLGDLTAPMSRASKGQIYEWRGVKPTSTRCWVYAKEKMEELEKNGRIIYSKSGIPNFKRYLDENEGEKLPDVWTDIPQTLGNEFLGYPTQKPEALMERIIMASSNEGDMVADFFCGCGTTIAAAQKLGRSWLGSDISHLAIKLISKRLVDNYGENIKSTFEIHGFPKDIASAKELASGVKGGRLLFEEWIVEVMLHGILNDKRNTLGYDGHFTFDMNGVKNVALIEVKSGGATVTQFNHFIRTVEDRKAQMGIFVCFADEVTDNMRRISKQQGSFHRDYKYQKIQILTVEDILAGKLPDRPASKVETFKQAERKTIADATQKKLEL